MAKIFKDAVKKRLLELPRVELIPVTNMNQLETLRDQEIRDLLAKLILLSNRRGRPRKSDEEEIDYAA